MSTHCQEFSFGALVRTRGLDGIIVATDRAPFPEPPATASEACTISPRVATRSRAIARGFALRPLWVGMQ